MNEKEKYEIIKRLVDENGNKDRAAMTLGITRRQINRREFDSCKQAQRSQSLVQPNIFRQI